MYMTSYPEDNAKWVSRKTNDAARNARDSVAAIYQPDNSLGVDERACQAAKEGDLEPVETIR